MLEGDRSGTEFVQPIVVLNAGTHEEVIAAAALASVRAWLATPEDAAWGPWIATRFVKSVRRCKPGPFSRLAHPTKSSISRGPRLAHPTKSSISRGPRLEGGAVALVELGEARALGFAPVAADQLPAALQRLQVSGLERPRQELGGVSLFGPEADQAGTPELIVNPGLEMSTGKTAAQVAHGLFALVKGQEKEWRTRWALEGFPLRVWIGTPGAWTDGLEGGALKIEDAGFTEIEAGSCTVLARIGKELSLAGDGGEPQL